MSEDWTANDKLTEEQIRDQLRAEAWESVRALTERQLRDIASQHCGEVVPNSGIAIKPKRLGQVLSLRLSHDELMFLKEKAAAVGITPSALAREAILKLSPHTVFIDGRRVS